MGALLRVQVPPRVDQDERSEAQLHEGDRLLRTSMDWGCQDCPDLKLSNRPVRTRMPGGVAGEQPIMAAPDADSAQRCQAMGSKGTISNATMLMILISGFTAGPAVSL